MTPSGGPKRTSIVGAWSAEKLELLRCYLGGSANRGGFLPATRRARQRYYVDLFAGPGQNEIEETGQIIDGSPLIALKAGPPEFTGLYWVEADAENVASLNGHRGDYPHRDITILQGNANEWADSVLRQLPRAFPVLAFLDPYSTQLDWSTIRKLAAHKRPKIELFILFAYNQALVRLLPHNPEQMTPEAIAVLDRVMPSPEGWRNVYERRARRQSNPRETRRAFLDEYVAGLRDQLGYVHVPPPRLISSPDGHPLYFMVFASDHPAGRTIMSWCLTNVQTSRRQKLLLPYDLQY